MVLRPLCISSTTLCIFLLLLPCHFCHSCHVFFYCVSCVYAYPTLYEGCGLLGLHHSLLFPYDLRWCVGKIPYSFNHWASTLIVYFCAMSVGLLANWVHYLFPWASPLQIEPFWGGGSESRSWQWMRSSYRPVVQHPFILFGGALWLFASSSRPCSTISRMTWSRSFLGSVGFSILDLAIRQGDVLLMPILFEFGSGTSLGWKEWVDKELSDTGFMGGLQQAGVLKAIVSSWCLSHYHDLFNLHHLVR